MFPLSARPQRRETPTCHFAFQRRSSDSPGALCYSTLIGPRLRSTLYASDRFTLSECEFDTLAWEKHTGFLHPGRRFLCRVGIRIESLTTSNHGVIKLDYAKHAYREFLS